MVSTLVFDVDALTRVRELLGDVELPSGFVPAWDPAADPAQIAAARSRAEQRLRAAGLLVAAYPADPHSGSAPGSAEVNRPDLGAREGVHPSLRLALEGFG